MSTLAAAKPGCEHLSCDLQAAAALLRALAHPMRLRILCRLRKGEVSVAGFEAELGLKQPSLSQQLGLLRDAALVSTRREARSVVYRLADDRAGIILDALQAVQGRAAPSRPQAVPVTPVPVTPVPATPVPKAASPRMEARPSARIRPQRSAACGVFAVAGWDVAPGRSR